ncbi:hypothetical protein HEP84_06090 [Streptomyces sp. RLB1-33]|uniref:hypothetical protein n=1 Tax=Streptomyces mirabilis TaxID=68239 RepID=UPI002001E07D|nr:MULTISPECIES: hypothetical protein [Streptomyces]
MHLCRQLTLAAVRAWIAEHGEGPSVRQISSVTGLSLGGIAHALPTAWSRTAL